MLKVMNGNRRHHELNSATCSICPESNTIADLLLLVIFICLVFHFQEVVYTIAYQFLELSTAVWGGLLSGGLHALSGPDHLAAILPLILGKKWWRSSFYGSCWGLGHGLSSGILGFIGYALKKSLSHLKLIPELNSVADYVVGITLIVIGIMGVVEYRNEMISMENDDIVHKGVESSDSLITNNHSIIIEHSDVKKDSKDHSTSQLSTVSMTIFVNGFFLGLSWDGLPSLAPALAVESWWLLTAFLLSYAVGTVLTIGGASAVISESTKWLSSSTSINLPRILAIISSCLAVVVGFIWIIQSTVSLFDLTKDDGENFRDNNHRFPQYLFGIMVIGFPVILFIMMIMANIFPNSPQTCVRCCLSPCTNTNLILLNSKPKSLVMINGKWSIPDTPYTV